MRPLLYIVCLLLSHGSVAAEPPDGRLPALARPTDYRLDLELDPGRESFSGQVQIDLELSRASDLIWLHGKDLRVTAVTAEVPDGRRVRGSYEQRLETGVAALQFEQLLPAGPVTLFIDYGADYSRNLAGLFKVEEQGDAYVLAKSESIQARRYLPGFDEPGLKAVFHLRLIVPEGNRVIANSPETGRENLGDGRVAISFAPTRPMPTYLLSLAVGPFDVVERPPLPANRWRDRPVPLRGFARRGRGADLNYILDSTPEMVTLFERELQQPYPFQKLDIVAAPQWPSGATELSAAITYREQRILVGDDPAPGARLALVNVHAHELAHMWFGNLVTPPWWDDLWLKEGFATWGTPLVLTAMEPGAGHDLTAAARVISAMRLDSLASTRAIREPINANEDIRNAYDAITYSKSLGVIHMADRFFGAEVFRPALGRYIATFSDGRADASMFYQVIGRETDTPELAATFRSFVEQKGVPLLRTELRCGEGGVRVALSQERYVPLGSPITAKNTRWSVPVCLRDAGGRRHCDILTEASASLPLGQARCPAWVLPNAGGAGYYRWTLPAEQWSALVDDFDQLEATEALSLVDSAIAAFEAGELEPTLLLQVVEAAAYSPRRQVVIAPLSALERYADAYFDGAQRQALAARIGHWYRSALIRSEASEDPEQQLLHAELSAFMARVLHVPRFRDELSAGAAAFTGFERQRDPDALDSDRYLDALAVAVQDLGEPFVRHLLEFRAELDDPKFESASARALGSVDEPELLPLVQARILTDSIGGRESFDLLREATATAPVAQVNWQWLAANFPALIDKIPQQWRRRTPLLAESFCSDAGRAKLAALFERHADLAPGYRRAFDQVDERIRLCIALRPQAQALAAAL